MAIIIFILVLIISFLCVFIWHLCEFISTNIRVVDGEEKDNAIPPKPSRYTEQLTARDYYTVFEANPTGQAILNSLVDRFGGTSYVRGGQDADRETCFRAGQKHVVDHLLIQINRASQIQEKQPEVETDD